MFGDSVTPVSLTLSRREREPFGSVCYPGQDSVSTRYVTRLTGPARGTVTPQAGQAQRRPATGIQHPSRFNARWRLRLTGPTFSLRTPVGRASVAPPGNGHPSPFPFQRPVAAAPYLACTRLRNPPGRAYTRLRNPVGRASAAPPGNRHPAPFPFQRPVAAAPYRAYILPARSCRPGKRSAARQ